MHLNPSQLNAQLVSYVNETVDVVFLNINSNHFNSVKATCHKPYFRNIIDLKVINNFVQRTVKSTKRRYFSPCVWFTKSIAREERKQLVYRQL